MHRYRLKQKRKEAGYSQESLAIKLNVTKGTISNYENGHSTPSNEMLSDLADLLHTTTDYLLGRTENTEHGDIYSDSKEKKKSTLIREQDESYDFRGGRAFYGGSDQYSEEELAIAEAAAKAAIEAYRKGKKKGQEDK